MEMLSQGAVPLACRQGGLCPEHTGPVRLDGAVWFGLTPTPDHTRPFRSLVSDPLFPVFCKLSKRHHVRCSGRLDAQVTALKLIGGYYLDVLYVSLLLGTRELVHRRWRNVFRSV
jgi:hypothetical protein